MSKNQYVSGAVIRRLPRYYRFLGELVANGVNRISSKELAERMSLTASQIRQDLNCFGGFGQQGYGYNVASLHSEIRNILGLDQGFRAILVGVGNLGRAFSTHINFQQAGFTLTGLFDKNPELLGKEIAGIAVQDSDEMETFCRENKVDIAVLCVPGEFAQEIANRLIACGITSFWNFTHYDIKIAHPEVVVENVHLIDGLMALCYQVNVHRELDENETDPAELEES